jgi:hypothetical protein
MSESKIEINNFDDALKDDSPERLRAILKQFTGTSNVYANNVFLINLIENLKKLNRSTTLLNGIMISLILVQIALILVQVYLR